LRDSKLVLRALRKRGGKSNTQKGNDFWETISHQTNTKVTKEDQQLKFGSKTMSELQSSSGKKPLALIFPRRCHWPLLNFIDFLMITG